MIVADSSVWIDYFGAAAAPESRLLEAVLDGDEDIAILPIILTEVLMGFRSEKAFDAARKVMLQVPQLPISSATHVHAAQLFRRLREKGVTVRGAVDCVIAAACIDSGARLLTRDKDFAHIARHSELRLAA